MDNQINIIESNNLVSNSYTDYFCDSVEDDNEDYFLISNNDNKFIDDNTDSMHYKKVTFEKLGNIFTVAAPCLFIKYENVRV